MSLRLAWDRLVLAWVISGLIGYLVAVLILELGHALWLFVRTVYRNMGVQRYGS